MNKKTKIAGIILIIALIILIAYLIWPSEPTPEEKLEQWLETNPQVMIDDQETKVDSAKISEEYTHIFLIDENGHVFAIIPIDEFFNTVDKTLPGKLFIIPVKYYSPAPPPPAPIPVPVPVPTPPPIINQTNQTNVTPTPSPAPTPIPPNVTPTPSPPLPSCINLFWDGDESDFNCGGSCAPCAPTGQYCDDTGVMGPISPYSVPCNQHLGCWVNSDCVTNNCDMSAAQPLPAIDNNTGIIYNDYNSLRNLAGQTWIIPYSGICK